MFLPPGEKIVETKKCRISDKEFVITDKDLEFYDVLSPVFDWKKCLIPSPTISPIERQIRRMAWRNYDQFYKSTCSLTGQEIISTYRPGTPYKVANLESWWSDSWSPYEYNKKIDFSRPFFEQFRELDQMTLHMPLSVSKSENSTFTNFSVNNRNCYLCTRVAECEYCYYSLLIVRCKNCMDCADVSDSEYLYECVRTIKSYRSFYCTDCENCQECYFLKDCSGCKNCFGSCNLRNAQFVFNNKQLSESEYRKNLSWALQYLPNSEQIRSNFLHFCEQFPKKYITGFNNEDVSGNFLFSNAHVTFGFESSESEKIRYAYGTVHGRDCIDASFGYFCEKSLEICGIASGYGLLFSLNCLNDCHDLLYCKDCVTATSDCFGCISLKKWKHCILNTQYSQHEYETLAVQLIDHMRSTGEWGEFFPTLDSPYAYNESAANTHFPQEKQAVIDRGYAWYEWPKQELIAPSYDILPIAQYTESVVWHDRAQSHIDALLAAKIQCSESQKIYQILPQELSFYIENQLPIPTRHPIIRSGTRMKNTLPMELYDRMCDECHVPFWTAYSPERPEKILCEECYRRLVY